MLKANSQTFKRLIALLILFFICSRLAWAKERCLVAEGPYGAVSTAHPEATKAAIKMLRHGGNAVDAAVAAAFVLGVVEFSNSGLGGDGHCLIYLPSGQIEAWDASSPKPKKGINSSTSLGLPTELALLQTLHNRHGNLSLSEITAPAIRLASEGFIISGYLDRVLRNQIKSFNQAGQDIFAPTGRPFCEGEILRQPALAETILNISMNQQSLSFSGLQAENIISDLNANGSLYDKTELENYSPLRVVPVSLSLGPWKLIGAPPPSASTVTMAMTKSLFDKRFSPRNSTSLEIFLDVCFRVIQLEHFYFADCIHNPAKFFALSASLSTQIEPHLEKDSEKTSAKEKSEETTHLTTWDSEGRIVCMTLTLGEHFGGGVFSQYGFFYNSENRNFQEKRFKYPKNYPPTKGPISGKSPILILKDEKPVMALGGAGGPRIVCNLAYIIASVLSGSMNLSEAMHAPRAFPEFNRLVEIEWRKNLIDIDKLKKNWKAINIKAAGHDYFGLVAGVENDSGVLRAVADFHRDGSAEALKKDPAAPRTFMIQAFISRKRRFKNLEIAEPIQSQRQNGTGWKTISALNTRSSAYGPTNRKIFSFPHPVSAAKLSQVVTIFPDLPSSSFRSWEDPQQWLQKPILGSYEKAFFSRIPPELSGHNLVEWLLGEVGFRISYKRKAGGGDGESLLEKGFGDCSGKSRLINDILITKGIPCRLVGGIILREGLFKTTHLWNEVFLDGKWIPVCSVNHIFGRIPSHWLILRYGDTKTLASGGELLFNVRELVSSQKDAEGPPSRNAK